MHTLNFFIHFVEAHRYWGYTLLFFSMLIEGELLLTATGMLARLHAFHLFDAFFFAFAGVLTGDVLWYTAGRYLGNHHSHNRYLMFAIHRVKKFLPGIEKNPIHVIFISKFIYGLNHSTILALGFLKIPFKQFMRVQVLTSFVWSVIFILLGFLFGDAALTFTHRFDRLAVAAIIFFIILFVLERFVGKIIEKEEQKND